jgi:uncharacterized protein with FMN-binding domain
MMPRMALNFKRMLRIALFVLAVLSAALGIFFNWRGARMAEAINAAYAQVGPVDLSRLADGVYTAGAGDFVVTAQVETAIKAGRIISVLVTKQSSGPGHDAAGLPARIVEKQSPLVEVVAGATSSSKVIMTAVHRSLTGRR